MGFADFLPKKEKVVGIFYYNAQLDKEHNEDKYESQQQFFEKLREIPNFHLILCKLLKRNIIQIFIILLIIRIFMEQEKKLIGKILHFYNKISVAVIELTDKLSVGDEISIEGPSTNFTQTVDSMQIEHKNIKDAKKGDSIGLKVINEVKENDSVYKVMK
jgi:putative protease